MQTLRKRFASFFYLLRKNFRKCLESCVRVTDMKRMKIIPNKMYLPLLTAVAVNTVTYYGSRLWTSGRIHYNLSNPLDDKIPFLPWTISIYLGCYLFWIANYILGCRQEKEEAFRLMSADFLAKLVCLLCFCVFPTTNIRPEVEGKTLWDALMVWLYQTDAADNLFPSIHCLTSCFCVIAVRHNPKIPRWYRIASAVIAISIYLSTLTTKQHVIIDVIGGVALAEASYRFVKRSGFAAWYADKMTRMANRIDRRLSHE